MFTSYVVVAIPNPGESWERRIVEEVFTTLNVAGIEAKTVFSVDQVQHLVNQNQNIVGLSLSSRMDVFWASVPMAIPVVGYGSKPDEHLATTESVQSYMKANDILFLPEFVVARDCDQTHLHICSEVSHRHFSIGVIGGMVLHSLPVVEITYQHNANEMYSSSHTACREVELSEAIAPKAFHFAEALHLQYGIDISRTDIVLADGRLTVSAFHLHPLLSSASLMAVAANFGGFSVGELLGSLIESAVRRKLPKRPLT